MLIITSDRLSAFDVVLSDPIPDKGRVLNEMANFWFQRLGYVVPNQLTGIDPETVVKPEEREQVRGRSIVVKKLKPLPIEAVVRGYIIGSGWKDYQKTGKVCSIELPKGLQQAQKLPQPIFTPATKAPSGHAENISCAEVEKLIGRELAAKVRDVSVRLSKQAPDSAAKRGNGSPAGHSHDRHRHGVDLRLGDDEGGGEDAGRVRRALRGEGDVGAPHAGARRGLGEGRCRPRHEGDHCRRGRRGASRRLGRRAYHASRARRADAVETSAGTRFAALDRADAERHPGRDVRNRRSRRGERRALCGGDARAQRQGARAEARRVPQEAVRSRPQGRASQALNRDIARAAQMLRAGGLVAFPTETVYGLGADASNPQAVTVLYAAKVWPADPPVIVHLYWSEAALTWAR